MLPYTPAISDLASKRVHSVLGIVKHSMDTALDLGCGNGQKTFPLHTFNKVIGVDSSRPMLQDARKHNKYKNIKFKLGTFDDIPLPDKTVDVVTMWNAFHFANSDIIPELERVCRKDAVIYIVEPGPKSRYGFSNRPDAGVILKQKLANIAMAKRLLKRKNITILYHKSGPTGYVAIFKFI